MNRPGLRIAVLTTIAVAVPLLYNSCQGGLIGSGFSSAKSACQVAIENGGLVMKATASARDLPSTFALRKVQLEPERAPANVSLRVLPQLKTRATRATNEAPDVELAAGTTLTSILDNACLLNASEATPITQPARASGEIRVDMDRQAYAWTLDRAYTKSEVETLVAQDACVIGLSYTHEYKPQSMSFNDTGFAQQAHLPSVRAPEAYDYFYAGVGGMPLTGTAILIAVIDTGADWAHPDLASVMWKHNRGIGIDITTLNTSNVVFDPSDISSNGHGTHVSGAIAAVANNGMGTVGMMPYRAKIMPIRVFKKDSSGQLSTTSQYFYNALRFAYLNGASVANLSLGSVGAGAASDSVAEAGVNEAVANGMTVVTVIGNADSGNGVNIDGVTMSSIPGQYASKAGVIGVGSYDTSTGAKSYFSHYSTTFAEIGAPGAESATTGIYSTIPTAKGSYGRLSGTSQAAPLVTAAAGLAIGLIRSHYTAAPTPAEVERLLLTSAVKSATLSSYFKAGNRLDLLSLVQRVMADYPLTQSSNYVNIAASGCR